MRDFAAIDFETANNERTSVCSVGVVIVRDGEIVDTFGVPRCMALLAEIQRMPLYSLKYGSR